MGKRVRLVAGRACEVRERATGPLGQGHERVSQDWSRRSAKVYRLASDRTYTAPSRPAAYRENTTPSLGLC